MSEDLQSRAYRQKALKEIVQDLHEGSDIGAVQKRFARLIRNVSPQEIAEMEQTLIEEGIPVEQVQKVCDVHVQVFEETLAKQKKEKTLPGHPVHSYLQENREARHILRRVSKLIKPVVNGRKIDQFKKEFGLLKEIEIHYRRKENQLFPYLEEVGFTGPSKVMWGKHDEIREKINAVENSFVAEDWKKFRGGGRSLSVAIRRMIFMEEKILFPTALKKLSEERWVEIRNGEREIGYAWIQPGNLWDPSVVTARKVAENLGRGMPVKTDIQEIGTPAGTASEIGLDVGSLTSRQVNFLLKNLPLDVTYVDENDTVRYYSQGTERLFPRSPGVIGRSVHNCHPPKSVHVVEKILQSFKNKEKDVAEFWLTLNDRFVHIRYFPLYGEQGEYRGVIEVSQDVTDIRNLKGEKRLLDW